MTRLAGALSGAALGLLLAAQPTKAAVDSIGDNGFALTEVVHIAASAQQVYAALIVPSKWWDSAHTFSQDAANLSLDAKAGGCWCETIPGGGSVQHMIVVYVVPGKTLRLRGALGPFQGMAVDGAMTISLKPADAGTDVTLNYALGGYAKDGFAELARAGDRVIGEQLRHLKSIVEAGSPPASQAAAKAS